MGMLSLGKMHNRHLIIHVLAFLEIGKHYKPQIDNVLNNKMFFFKVYTY